MNGANGTVRNTDKILSVLQAAGGPLGTNEAARLAGLFPYEAQGALNALRLSGKARIAGRVATDPRFTRRKMNLWQAVEEDT